MGQEQQNLFQELQRANQELLRAYDETIEGWVRALALRDRNTEGHSLRLVELSLKVARELGLGGEDLVHLRRGALLHDIGKLAVADAILFKPGALTPTERKYLELHTQFGYEFLAPISFLKPAAEIAYCHHENWDGSGYPRGLKGENIPLLARIVSVCNVFDVLASDQPYRAAWDNKNALRYIEEKAGKQFDPKIVEVFLGLFSHENQLPHRG